MIKASIIGASGYGGGELLRLLLGHPEVEVQQVTSDRLAGKPVKFTHPNLRGLTDLKFSAVEELEKCELLFTAMPHGMLSQKWSEIKGLAPKIIDLSADFRLKDPELYKTWYGEDHPCPEVLEEFSYGIVELHREEMKQKNYISGAGCNATTSILGLYPLVKSGLIDASIPITLEAKVGSSEAGNKHSSGSHHPERKGVTRSYKPTGHRHTAEIIQELGNEDQNLSFNFSATSIDTVRGILVTAHVMTVEKMTDLDLWKIYREAYQDEPFVRIVKERQGIYRYPEPKILAGTNICEVGFECDPHSNRVVVISALDNLMKGAAGQAVHGMNVMMGWEEKTGLEFPGLHPC